MGVLEVNCHPENYHTELEQAAFAPANVVPGISFSPDEVLQARLLSYPDAHRYRLGNDDYTQAGNLSRLLPANEQQRLFCNIAAARWVGMARRVAGR